MILEPTLDNAENKAEKIGNSNNRILVLHINDQ